MRCPVPLLVSLLPAAASVLVATGSWAQTASPVLASAQATSTPPIGAQIVAPNTAPLAAPMSGQLIVFPVVDGESIHEGQVLARFNCNQQEALRGRARAELLKRQDLMTTQQALKALNAYSKADYAAARNDVEVAKAELKVADATIENCEVKAPFDGRVASISVRNFQFIQAGAPLLDLVDDRDLEVELIVSSMLLSWLTVGTEAHIHVSETQRDYDARITRLSGKVDAASQTIKVYGKIAGDVSTLLPGMSGVATFPHPSR
jgi:RND family efflux transporter MFP subunit